jgi:hypothetical protein
MTEVKGTGARVNKINDLSQNGCSGWRFVYEKSRASDGHALLASGYDS